MKVTSHRLLAMVFAANLSLPAASVAGMAWHGDTAASLAGTAQNAAGQTAANITVQLRDLATGQLAGATTSTATGSFGFTGLAAGTYSVEIVNAAGQIIGASIAISVTAGASVSGITVTASAALAAASVAAGVGGAAAGATISTAVIVATAASAAGIAAVVAVAPVASPSR